MVYFVSWTLFFLLAGGLWFLIDRAYGNGIFRFYYDLTHKDPLPEEDKSGFIYEQRAQARFAAAIFLAFVQSLLMLVLGDQTFVTEFISFVLEVPALMAGFYLGPYFGRFWKKKDEILETVDQIEAGEISVQEELREMGSSASAAVRELLGREDEEKDEDASETQELTPDTRQEPSEKEQAKEEKSPQDYMKGYLRDD